MKMNGFFAGILLSIVVLGTSAQAMIQNDEFDSLDSCFHHFKPVNTKALSATLTLAQNKDLKAIQELAVVSKVLTTLSNPKLKYEDRNQGRDRAIRRAWTFFQSHQKEIDEILQSLSSKGGNSSAPLLQDWVGLGLVKTHPLEVQPGQKITVTCTFDKVTAPTTLSFLNSAQNGYYDEGVTVSPGQTSATFTSVVPQGENRTWLIIRNPAFDGSTALPLGVQIKQVLLDVEKSAPLNFLQDWVGLGLVKTKPLDVQPGQKLTVTCTFDKVTAPTAISFLNSAQNGYYDEGVTVVPGQTSATFTSVVPLGEKRAWLIMRNPAFDGKTALPLGVQINQASLLNKEKVFPSSKRISVKGEETFPSGTEGERAKIFEQNQQVSQEGYDFKGTPIKIDTASTIQGTKVYGHVDDEYKPNLALRVKKYQTKVSVRHKDTIDCAIKMKEKGLNPLALDMANATSVCGAAKSGKGNVQEEQITYRSNLYVPLNEVAKSATAKQKLGKGNNFIPREGGIYVPNVTIFRHGEDKGYAFRDKPISLDIGAIAAYRHESRKPQKPADIDIYGELIKGDKYWESTKRKVYAFFDMALENGNDSLVLGALGCGAFGNPPEEMIKVFQDVLKEYEGCFKEIRFAVLGNFNFTKFSKAFN
ncbi:MAG: TIGR02452 family protein [Proteobacteria bacterium]|nr:TIGR02452 family protein [Pseudomonadota bacterium]